MRLLFTSSIVPVQKPFSDFETATNAVARAFEQSCDALSYVGSVPGDMTAMSADKTSAIEMTGPASSQSLAALWAGYRHRRISAFSTPASEHQKHLDAAVEKIDGLVINGIGAALMLGQKLAQKPYIYIAHQNEREASLGRMALSDRFVEKLVLKRDSDLLGRLEQELCRKASHTLVLSEQDRSTLHLDDGNSSHLPLAPEKALTFKDARARGFDVGLSINWQEEHQRQSLEWFLKEVAPKLPENMIIAVAGKVPAGFKRRNKKIIFLGKVLDTVDFLRQCRVIALTSQAKSGIDPRLLAVLSLGIAAVATPASTQTLPSLPANILSARHPDAFAKVLQEHVLNVRTGMITPLNVEGFISDIAQVQAQAVTNAIERLK